MKTAPIKPYYRVRIALNGDGHLQRPTGCLFRRWETFSIGAPEHMQAVCTRMNRDRAQRATSSASR